MRNRAICLALVLSSAPFGSASAGGATSAPVVSWGKPDVSFDDYRKDSTECGKRGATTSMREHGEFDAVLLGLTHQDIDMDIGRSLPPSLTGEDPAQKLGRDYALNGAKSRPEPRVKALQKFLVENVEACLSEKGYVRFSLTPVQSAELGGYKKGTEGRFRYLHALASNEAVLLRQRYAP